MKAKAWVFVGFVACADKAPPPAPAAEPAPSSPTARVEEPAATPGVEPASPEACKRAEKLRRSGFNKLLDLELEGAKADFNAVLRLDPGDVGAMHQLDVIEAMEQGKLVGTSEANSSRRSQATRSRCKSNATEPSKGKWLAKSESGAVLMSTVHTETPPKGREGVQAVLTKLLLPMGACADKTQPTQRSLAASIRFVIDHNGNVTTPEVTGIDGALQTCVLDVVKSLRFAARDLPVDVAYAVDFARQ